CTFADNGVDTVRARIIDKNDGFTEYTTDVTVKNVPPKLTPPADQTADEGTGKSFGLGSFSDPGPDATWQLHITWGDGSAANDLSYVSTGATGSLASQSHTYGDNGTYHVTVRVTDKDLGYGEATFDVTVANVPPTATLGNGGAVDEGSPATISFSAQHDPSGADTAAGFHDSVDCHGGGTNPALSYASPGTSAPPNCPFADH